MANAWQRRRNPDDVPTPIAVAVSDFCRRAGVGASPAEVRDALSLISEEEDFRVRALTDSEPEARPLGPHAVIDVLRGTAQDVAATRQNSGYYALARELVTERERTTPTPLEAPPSTEPAPAAETGSGLPGAPSRPAGKPGKEKKAPPPTMAEKIAPKKRAAQPLPSDVDDLAHEDLPALEPARDREKPRPKGRYANIAPTRHTADELFEQDAEKLLVDLVEQYPDRFALTRTLGETYTGRKEGQPLRTEDVERALEHHGLTDKLERKERQAVLGAYSEQRGAAGRVSFALGLSVPELNRLVKALGLAEEVELVRERFRRDALSPRNLAARIDLLGRGKYLSDLGIRRRFDDALKNDLKKLLQKYAPRARTREDLVGVVARQEGTQPELLSRAIEKLGLSDELRRLSPEGGGEDGSEHAT